MIKKGTCSLYCDTDGDGLPGVFRVLTPGFYVSEHLFVNPQTSEVGEGVWEPGKLRAWCISHVQTGKLIIGPAHKLSPTLALLIAVELIRFPVDWSLDDPAKALDDRNKHAVQQKTRELIAAETHRVSKITDEIFKPKNVFPYPVGKYIDDGIHFA